MKMKLPLFVACIVLCALPFLVSAAQTVTTKSVTQQSSPVPAGKPINLSDFDINRDGILSTAEVGEMLFRLFDTNTDNVIDATEYETKSILTVIPMTKETVITYDTNNDGIADKTQYTSQTFMQDTQLARFGGNTSGLSPHELVDKDFVAIDADASGSIDRTEWRNAYITKIGPMPVQPVQ